MISTSTPKSFSWPRISTTRPRGFWVALGQSVISTSTTTPSRSCQSVWRAAWSPMTRSRDFFFCGFGVSVEEFFTTGGTEHEDDDRWVDQEDERKHQHGTDDERGAAVLTHLLSR